MKWRRGIRAELAILFLASCLLLFPLLIHMDRIPYHPNADYTDLLTSHWPNAYFLKTELSEQGILPLWNPLILSGAPLIADPLFSVWYPPNWLTLFLPLTPTFNILFIVHIAWASIGMFIFLRSEGKSRSASIIAAIAFGGTPKLIGHIGLGHIGLVSAVAWTPWVLTCFRRLIDEVFDDTNGVFRWTALAGAVIAITFLADPRWLIPVAGLSLVYIIRLLISRGWFRSVAKSKLIRTVLLFGFTALGISAGLSLPLSEFLNQTTRANIARETAASISLPLSDLIKFFIPDLGGWPETLPFVGIMILGLVLIGVVTRSKGWKFWSFVTLGALLLAMGHQTPIYSLISSIIPGMKFIRVPARFLFISSFGLAVLASQGLETTFSAASEYKVSTRLASLGYFAGLVLLGSAILLTDVIANGSGQFMIASAGVFAILIFASMSARGNLRVKVSLWFLAVMLELLLMGGSLLETVPEEVAFHENDLVLQLIESEKNLHRVFSTSYNIPQNVAAIHSLQLADGINPLQLKDYVTYMASAVGFPPESYSVTLPPFPDGDPTTPQPFKPEARDLGYLNITYVLSQYPLEATGLTLMDTIEGTYIYNNERSRPRAWIEKTYVEGSNWVDVDSIDWSPNEIILHAQGPGLLVISELNYPGWIASVDDQQVEIEEYHGLFRSLRLADGEHVIKFSFRPRSVFIGAGISVLTIIAFAWVWLKR